MEGEGDIIERKLQGRTLQVYLYLLRKGEPGGIREIQRDLGLSSPSVADYQVEKLVGMGLAAKDSHGRVYVARKVRVRALESYVNFGRFSVPRLAFYASVFSAVSVLYVIFNLSSWNVYGLAVPAAAAGVLWLEAWRMWRFSLLERADKAPPDKRVKASGILPLLAPGAAALVVFAIGGAFLFQYVQEPPSVQAVQGYIAPEAEAGHNHQQQTIEESAEISREKVAAAGQSALAMPGLASSVLPLAGAAVIGFLGYPIVKYRCSGGRVLEPEQALQDASGTQDYPERFR